MNAEQRATIAAFDALLGFTGRDGAVDYAGKSQMSSDSDRGEPDPRFAQALGQAVIATWSELARNDQERIFECAVDLGADDGLREELAKFLHDRHSRTVHKGG